MKPIWKILIVLAVLIAVAAALLMIPHYRAKAAVKAYREQLKARGEKLTFGELAPALSHDEIAGGQELVSAVGMASNFTNSPPMMKWLAPGHALVGSSEAISPADNTSNCWPEFSAVVKRRPEIAAQIREALQRPGIGFHVQYDQGYSALLPYLPSVRKAGIWLSGAMMLALHEGDTNSAWTNLLSEIELVGKYQGEPVMVCQSVRVVMLQTAVFATWEALQHRGWSEEQLAQLQAKWEAIDLTNQAVPALAMERAMLALALDQSRESFKAFDSIDGSGGTTFNSVLTNPREELGQFLGRRPRYWMWKWRLSYQLELYGMQLLEAAADTIRSANSNNAFMPAQENFKETTRRLGSDLPRQNRIVKDVEGLAEHYSSFLSGIAQKETERRMVITVVALERYRLRHGEYPARLEDLTPDFLKKVPIDFMDGKPLRYRRNNDGTFLLYSVGEDGKDDGGDGSPVVTDPNSFKHWYHQMRDAVWPGPATAEEVKKYESDLLQKYRMRQPVPQPRRLVPPMSVPPPANTNSNAK
jgi:hypothetical protein